MSSYQDLEAARQAHARAIQQASPHAHRHVEVAGLPKRRDRHQIDQPVVRPAYGVQPHLAGGLRLGGDAHAQPHRVAQPHRCGIGQTAHFVQPGRQPLSPRQLLPDAEVIGEAHEVQLQAIQVVAVDDLLQEHPVVLAHFGPGIVQLSIEPAAEAIGHATQVGVCFEKVSSCGLVGRSTSCTSFMRTLSQPSMP